ncbi:DUF382-domain-containing protein [Violaceomyces palustris]|uniref:DUF382-domain-containing protein n=1 Tax=Violaceomyces palustris TaxID=1673888 RepID=A0ACD0P593_9BASI|nr:DUF382-domain-containing protein [Violaceomyces palustris]
MSTSSHPNGADAQHGLKNGESSNSRVPLTKNAKRRAKKRQATASQPERNEQEQDPATRSQSTIQTPERPIPSEQSSSFSLASLDQHSETYKAFANVFSRFGTTAGADDKPDRGPEKGQVIYSDDEMLSDSDATDAEQPKLSKRKQKKLQRLTVAELKQLVKRPEVVEWSDVTATDPRLLVQLKSQRNTIPVPPHWSQKRDYLQNKRGIEKAPFQLPSYIAGTGIATMKDALNEKEAEKTLKNKTRERVQPKMGKMDIDYQKLHDAFFRFQTKPPMSIFGETYYEGKENETKFKERRPGDLSDELKEALSIPPLAPPPWLIAMQRYGPPPSYPHLKIAGLNAPIPEGAQWGFHPGGWGRPPVDESGRPLFGGPAVSQGEEKNGFGEAVQKELWGELEPEEEEESDAESDEDEGDSDQDSADMGDGLADGLQTPSGMETPSGFASVTSTVPGGLETPGFLELRKDGRGGSDSTFEDEQQDDGRPKQLYQVIPETGTSVRGFMGSEKAYALQSLGGANGQNPQVLGAEERGTKRKHQQGGVDVALDPSELELSQEELQERFEKARRADVASKQPGGADREEVSAVREELSRQRQTSLPEISPSAKADIHAMGSMK